MLEVTVAIPINPGDENHLPIATAFPVNDSDTNLDEWEIV